MNKQNYDILIIEDNQAYAKALHNRLKYSNQAYFKVTHTTSLTSGLKFLKKHKYDLLVLDLNLPDADGIETFYRVKESNSCLPVVILSAADDEEVAIGTVKQGAQEYLVKGKMDGKYIDRTLVHNIERGRIYTQMNHESITDELTGVYNRRGFKTLANQHLKLTKRYHQHFYLFMMDVNHLKAINDEFGHEEGDRAIINTAKILNKTFRDSDIVSRLGGDEFVVMALDAHPSSLELMKARLEKNLNEFNASASNSLYALCISIGHAIFDPVNPKEIEELLKLADQSMYSNKVMSGSNR